MVSLSRGKHDIQGAKSPKFREREDETRSHRLTEENIGGKGASADWRLIQKASKEGTELAAGVSAGLDGFQFGGHEMGSSGRNITFRDVDTQFIYSPMWQGISSDGQAVVQAAARRYGALTEDEPIGSVSSSGSLPCSFETEVTDNTEIFRISVVPAENYSGELYFSGENSVTDLVYRQEVSTDISADVQFDIDLRYPSAIKAGDSMVFSLTAANDSPVSVRPSVGNPAAPYRENVFRRFFDDHSMLPVGTIIDWYGDILGLSVPDGFAACDGSLIDAFYSPLDGLSAPDLAGKVIAGADDVSGSLPGETLTIFTLPASTPNLVVTGKRFVTKLIKL